jgi:hypothetical protein
VFPFVLALAAISGCFGPSQPPPEEDTGVVRRRGNTTAKGASPSPAPKRSGASGPEYLTGNPTTGLGPGGAGTASGTVETDPNVSPPPPLTGSPFPSVVPSTGLQIAFEERTGNWGIRPYLNRPRAGHVAGAFKDRLMVVEGDHRPSLETLAAGADRWGLDDTYDAQFGLRGEGQTLGQGLSLGVGAMAYEDTELWLAGGLAGVQNADGTQGAAALHLYRVAEGYASARKDESARTMGTGRHAAAGGLVEGAFVIAGGISKPGQIVQRVELVAIGGRAKTENGPAMPVPVAGAASTVALGRLYVIGGYTFTGGKPAPVDQVQVYDGKSKAWLAAGATGTLPALPVKLHGAAAAFVPEVSTIYVAGGFDATGKPLDTVYAFSLTAGDRWNTMRPMPTARGLLSLTAFNGALWAIGGVGQGRKALQTVEAYQP